MGLALAAAPVVALAGALLFGWFAVRLSGVYLAMLTLAFAQIVWALVFQWEALTGGSNGVIGVWPPAPFDKAWVYFLLTVVLATIAVLLGKSTSTSFAPGCSDNISFTFAPQPSGHIISGTLNSMVGAPAVLNDTGVVDLDRSPVC